MTRVEIRTTKGRVVGAIINKPPGQITNQDIEQTASQKIAKPFEVIWWRPMKEKK